ncbi:hypothetical protein [Microbacterium sp. ZW T5_56]
MRIELKCVWSDALCGRRQGFGAGVDVGRSGAGVDDGCFGC